MIVLLTYCLNIPDSFVVGVWPLNTIHIRWF